ncbi:hypothetical protein GCM10025873_10310 [Demequina sediminis]|nr:hypothetical protein GCM10025873_10310 [Demequina sediminis]
MALPCDGGHRVAVDAHAQRDLVTARGVELVRLAGAGGVDRDEATTVRLARVVHDDLLIHLFEGAHALTPKKLRTAANASTNAWMSSSVV